MLPELLREKKSMGFSGLNWTSSGGLNHDQWGKGIPGLEMAGTEVRSHK